MDWIIGLLVVGLTLCWLELFLPGAIAGIVGGCCLVAAIVLSFVHYGFNGGLLCLATVMVMGMFLFAIWVKYFPKSVLGRKMILGGPGSDAGKDSKVPVDIPSLNDRIGIAYTDLRPSGNAIIDEKRYDVVTEGSFIQKGSQVKVVKVENNRIVVRSI